MAMGRFPTMTAEEAADLIPHGATLGIGGFTDPGIPQAVTGALTKRARALHEAGEPFKIRILAGAEAGPAGDVELAKEDALSFRMPFQSESACRDAINEGRIEYHDEHLSHCAQQILEGFFGPVDIAIVEATGLSSHGRVHLTTAVGNAPTFLAVADKVIIELNRRHDPEVSGLSDIYTLGLPPHRKPLSIGHPLDRIGRPYATVDPDKVVAVVETCQKSTRPAPREPDAASRAIAENLVRFFLEELAAGRLPQDFLPLQSGVGNIGNALIADLAEHDDMPPFTMYTEVFQDSCLDAMRACRLTAASAGALTLSEDKLDEFYADFDSYRSRLVLRPQEISNNPAVIRQLGVIASNTALEVDIYGHVNSSHVCGTQLMNGLGGAGDFERNARLSIFLCHSIAKGGRVSSIVPFCSHVDHSEHSAHVIVTEQGLADLRGLGPAARARLIIDNCAHPAYRDYLHRYVETARQGHLRHDLARCFELHRNFMEYGAMLPDLDLDRCQ
jgi:propionyl-CoA:succinyl-CoA transferase